jgi:hypothetical protein
MAKKIKQSSAEAFNAGKESEAKKLLSFIASSLQGFWSPALVILRSEL